MGNLKLFKYVSLGEDVNLNNSKLSALANKKAWLSTFVALNDPFEAKATYFDKKQLQIKTGASDLKLKLMAFVLNYLNNKYVVYSLTESSYDCMPMWAHYANNHRGFCIEYESNDVFYDSPDIFCEMQKVNYADRRRSVANFIEEQLKFYSHMKATGFAEPPIEIQDKITDALEIAQRDNFFTKHVSWSYENEYRIVYTAVPHGDFPHGDTEKIEKNLKETNASLAAIQEKKGVLVDLAEIGLVTAKIYVGLACSEEHAKLINRISNSLGCGNALQLSFGIEQMDKFHLVANEIIGY